MTLYCNNELYLVRVLVVVTIKVINSLILILSVTDKKW